MFKNIGNSDYFQKNKKTVLSLVGISLLTGAAVTDRVVLSQEIADVHKIRPDEKHRTQPHPAGLEDKLSQTQEIIDIHKIRSDDKHRIPPRPVDIQDKLSRIKSKSQPRALLYNGWVSVGSISGYDVKYRQFAIGSDYIYQILGTSSSDGNQLGFACFCANSNTVKTWKGGVNSSCDAANPNTPVKLDNPIMGVYSIAGVPIPDGSCCKSAPRVGATLIPGLPKCS
ncbi:hypothetical protein [Methylobacter sp.]|jgi:hypothetical protein|uniref:hypothetical protein n=1 Tax=Methylobacter sp. TaxID=2051955 RepID=UPI003DA370CB